MQVEHPQGCEKTLYLRISVYYGMSDYDLVTDDEYPKLAHSH
jgi:hypothetical protein